MEFGCKRWRLLGSAAGACLFALLLFSTSDSVHTCEVERKKWSTAHRSPSRPGYAARVYRKVNVQILCAANADDVWVALSGVAVAFFTFTLWRSTEKLWLSDQESRKDVERSIRAAEDSVRAANRQADIARESLVVSTRPWLDFSVEIAGDLTWNEDGSANLPLSLKIQNLGYSPATQTRTIPIFRPAPGGILSLTRFDKDVGEFASDDQDGAPIGPTVFPNSTLFRKTLVQCGRGEIDRSLKPDPFRGVVFFELVIIVFYRLPGSTKERHTRKAFSVTRAPESKTGDAIYFRLDTNVSQVDYVLTPQPWSEHAD